MKTNLLTRPLSLILGLGLLATNLHAQVTATDILLEPDATLLQHAEAHNARMLKADPKGFSLDASHRPHITVPQCFVHTADLEKVYAAAHKLLAPGVTVARRVSRWARPVS